MCILIIAVAHNGLPTFNFDNLFLQFCMLNFIIYKIVRRLSNVCLFVCLFVCFLRFLKRNKNIMVPKSIWLQMIVYLYTTFHSQCILDCMCNNKTPCYYYSKHW